MVGAYLADAVDLLDGLAVLAHQLEVAGRRRRHVDRVHDGVLDVVVQQAEHVPDLVHGQLLQADAGVVRALLLRAAAAAAATGAADGLRPAADGQLLVAAVVLVVVEVDVAGGPRVRQLAAETVERLVAVHVVPYIHRQRRVVPLKYTRQQWVTLSVARCKSVIKL